MSKVLEIHRGGDMGCYQSIAYSVKMGCCKAPAPTEHPFQSVHIPSFPFHNSFHSFRPHPLSKTFSETQMRPIHPAANNFLPPILFVYLTNIICIFLAMINTKMLTIQQLLVNSLQTARGARPADIPIERLCSYSITGKSCNPQDSFSEDSAYPVHTDSGIYTARSRCSPLSSSSSPVPSPKATV